MTRLGVRQGKGNYHPKDISVREIQSVGELERGKSEDDPEVCRGMPSWY